MEGVFSETCYSMLWLVTFCWNYKQERSNKNTSLQVCDIQILGFKQVVLSIPPHYFMAYDHG